MKTRFLILTFCFCAYSLFGQITLQHTFSNDYTMTNRFNTHNATMYYNYNPTTQIINIYNADFSLYKTLTISPPSGYKFVGPLLFSDNLFNTDNLLEFIMIFQSTSNTDEYEMVLYNENLHIIMDLGNRQSAYAFTTMDNQTKLDAYLSYYDANTQSIVSVTDIYKLPGTIPNPNPSDVNDIGFERNFSIPYPNPAGLFINLPYLLKENESSTMKIFNSLGQLVDSIEITGTSNCLKISVDKYPSGVYIYEYKGISNTFIVK